MPAVIYLDNNATTPVPDEVLQVMTPYYREFFGNAHATHSLGRRAHDAVEEARADVAALMGAASEEVIFTSCGTEGNALVIRGLLDAGSERRKIVTTSVEHPSVLALLRALQNAGSIDLQLVGVYRSGAVDLDAMREAVDDRTLLVSVMLAQNETGVIHPVREIAAIAAARGALLHVDAVQAAGKVPLSLAGLGADFMTISGHKFHAPKGVGALAIAKGRTLRPLWYGGGQELGMRSGTEPVPSIAGLGTAARMALASLPTYADKVGALRDRFESQLRARLGGVSVNGAGQARLANTANVSFHDTYSDDVVRALDRAGVCISAGAACNSGNMEPSSTMKAMGVPLPQAIGAVRFSLSRYTTAEEVDRSVEIACEAVTSLRSTR
jgi:cysteine desulfurase